MKLHKRIIAAATATIIACSLFAGCNSSGSSKGSTSSKGTESSSSASSVEPSKSESSKTQPTAGDKTLKLYVAGFQNLDPQIWSWGTHVDRMGIFEGLTLLNSDFTTRMGNAESLEHNEDYTVWTAKLRKDLKWSDGMSLNAKDYYYSLQRVIDPQYLQGKTTAFNTNAPILNALECQRGEVSFDKVGIKLVDDYTLEFTLSTACADFDVRLAESWGLPVPQHAIDEFGDDWTKPENIVVNGPYIPTAREEDVHLTLTPNSEYYEMPALKQIDLYMGTQNQLLAYQNGDINVATITAADIDAVNADTELSKQMKMFDTSVVTYIGLLRSEKDVLQQNPKIRQAISLSIDRETIATSVDKNTVTAAHSLVYPGFVDWTEDLGIIEHNVEKAQKLMEEAGYPNGEGLGEMTCLMAGTPGADILAVVDMIQRGTGIKVKLVNLEWAAFVKERDGYHEDGTWGIFIDAWNTSVANVSGAFNNMQFDVRLGNLEAAGLKAYAEANKVMSEERIALETCKNKDANAYAEKSEQLLKESDPEVMNAGYKELEAMRLENAANIPLWWGKSVLLIQPSIEGYEGNPLLLNSPPFYFKDVKND